MEPSTLRARGMRRNHANLVSRSHPARTFGSLAAFAGLVFLCIGIYLISQPLVDPISAHDAGVVAGAFVIALASILLFYVVRPGVLHRHEPLDRSHAPATGGDRTALPNRMTIEALHLPRERMRPSLD